MVIPLGGAIEQMGQESTQAMRCHNQRRISLENPTYLHNSAPFLTASILLLFYATRKKANVRKAGLVA